MKKEKLEIAAFGMGCFWGPDALLGAEEGIKRTRVGYAGGTMKNPTYSDIGNHTETILVEFDPVKISYSKLLTLFWDNHYYHKKGKNQYASRIFYTDEKQKKQAQKSKEEKEFRETVATKILELNFTAAEDYHQKYRLRHSKMMENFSDMSPAAFRDSPLAAKLNAYAAGHLDLEDIKAFDLEFRLSIKDRLMNSARKIL